MFTVWYETNEGDAASGNVEHGGLKIREFGELVVFEYNYPVASKTKVCLYRYDYDGDGDGDGETSTKKPCAPPNTIGTYIGQLQAHHTTTTIGTRDRPFFYVELSLSPQQQQEEKNGVSEERLKKRHKILETSPDNKRRFTVNGSIDKSKRDTYFFVTTTDSNKSLYKKIQKGSYILLHGPRAAGKSTRMLQACDDLNSEFHCLNLSLSEVSASNPETFWKTFSRLLEIKYSGHGLHEVATAVDFVHMWYKTWNKHLDKEKKFVLFIDEFDVLDSPRSNEETLGSVLETFRSLKESSMGHQLHCVVIIGVFHIVRLNTQKISPCNIGDAVIAPLLTLDQVRGLFNDYKSCWGYHIDEKVVTDIYERTGGHAGLVNLCGKSIDEDIRRRYPQDELSLEVWLRELRLRLKVWLGSFSTVKRLVDDMCADGPLQKSCRETLWKWCLSREGALPSEMLEVDVLDFLTSVGMVREDDNGDIVIANSMVRMLAIWHIAPHDRRRQVAHPLPMSDGKLDMQKLLLLSTIYFPSEDLIGAVLWSFKTAGRGFAGKVPHEYYYQSQLASILRMWLPVQWRFFPEVKKDGAKRRIDFVIESTLDSSPEMRYVLELEATSSNAELKEHYTCAAQYGQLISADHVWVIHFSAALLKAEELPIPQPGVHVLHLVHVGLLPNQISWSALYCEGGGTTRALTIPEA